MLIDNNLIAYEYYKNQFTPKEVYHSGERDETKLIDKYSNRKELPVLLLEDDIINSEGKGLKKGFYNVVPDEYKDFLLIYQTGQLKAKIPVIKMNVIPPSETKQQKPKKMSQWAYKRHLQKEYRKYLNGINPDEYEYTEVEISYVQENNAWVILYKTNNLELTGMIKF
ncbi:MAG: hypothetical protein IJ877_04925 [Candidatus Gastranaerophilales bacterium]|nr:hypothetical protein [Candidatus Gastranaerophilales bacterium]